MALLLAWLGWSCSGSVVRVGIILTVLLLALADRIGRRRILVGAAVAAPLLAAVGALAPSLAVLTAMQTIARPVAISLGLVVTIVAAEEMPPGSRAYAVSVLGLAYALGAGTCVWALPLADLGTHGWRLIYAVGLVYLVVAVSLYRGVPESRRYERPTPSGRRSRGGASSCWPRRRSSTTCSSPPRPSTRTATSRTSAATRRH